ncbi:MAG TPA: PCRF domain-containing protein, partial [Pseudodesulfovibrio sp.]|nr:PCRF domain-containing protein [Pseudodesulfovibrio sp.]
MAPDFWNDQDRARTVQQEQGWLKDVVGDWESCQAAWEEADLMLQLALEENDPEAEKEVEHQLDQLESRLDATELECMFTGEHDANNALLTIHAGAGGTEAQDWVSILLRMYLRWAEENGFKTEILDQLPGD